ncbi:DUF4391 domain-containing protein [Limosilactobacillus fermentum]|uniref:DUF4391 domain-containing protein n=1 Tax=Limosilactobacillus fermentum TaxID=1613 RepID=UPI002F26D2A8
MAVDQVTLGFLLGEVHFPKTALFNRVIAKEVLIKSGGLSSKDRNVITDEVKQINWVFLLKESNTNITEYRSDEYDVLEIDYLDVQLRSGTHVKQIAKILFDSIPKKLIVSFNWKSDEGELVFTTVMAEYSGKRGANKAVSANKLIFSELFNLQNAEITSYFDFDKVGQLTLETIYQALLSGIEKFNFKKRFGKDYAGSLPLAEVNNELAHLQDKHRILLIKAKKERQLNLRMALVSEARELLEKINELKG